jgi:hypothetical protein
VFPKPPNCGSNSLRNTALVNDIKYISIWLLQIRAANFINLGSKVVTLSSIFWAAKFIFLGSKIIFLGSEIIFLGCKF